MCSGRSVYWQRSDSSGCVKLRRCFSKQLQKWVALRTVTDGMLKLTGFILQQYTAVVNALMYWWGWYNQMVMAAVLVGV